MPSGKHKETVSAKCMLGLPAKGVPRPVQLALAGNRPGRGLGAPIVFGRPHLAASCARSWGRGSAVSR